MFKFNGSMIGHRVRFVNAKDHEEMPWCYPEVGTIGIVVSVKGTDFEGLVDDFAIQWPNGATSMKDCWLANEGSLELVKEEVDKP